MRLVVDFDDELIRSQEIIIKMFQTPGIPAAFDKAVLYWLSDKLITKENGKYKLDDSFIQVLGYLAANNFESYEGYLTQERLSKIESGSAGLDATMETSALFIHGGELDIFDRTMLLISLVGYTWHKKNQPITPEVETPTQCYLNMVSKPVKHVSGFKEKTMHLINRKRFPVNYSIRTNPMTMAMLALVTPNKYPMDIVAELKERELGTALSNKEGNQ